MGTTSFKPEDVLITGIEVAEEADSDAEGSANSSNARGLNLSQSDSDSIMSVIGRSASNSFNLARSLFRRILSSSDQPRSVIPIRITASYVIGVRSSNGQAS